MVKVILIREPGRPNVEWLDPSVQRAVQRAVGLANLHDCKYRVDSQGNYVVRASSWYASQRQFHQQSL
jgi:hypothetical protein